jgi:3',5'-cyclic AMP phosphodiesterase CpdA
VFSLIHVSDPHFGVEGDLEKVEAIVSLLPDLEPNLVVVSGDLTVRARHGEFQAARVWIRELERTAPVYVTPGNHDVQWWLRPLVPFRRQDLYRKYARYFGPVLAPTMTFDEATVAGVPTAHGIDWPSLTTRVKDLAVKGHGRAQDFARARMVFQEADPEAARILVMHHNPLRGERSERFGLTRWKTVHRWIIESEAELVLCGHDHQHKADVMGGVIISCAGTISSRLAEGVPSTFHRISIEGAAVQVELYKWEADRRVFRRTDVQAFARPRISDDAEVTAGIV